MARSEQMSKNLSQIRADELNEGHLGHLGVIFEHKKLKYMYTTTIKIRAYILCLQENIR